MQKHNSGNVISFEISKTTVAWAPDGARARVGVRPLPRKINFLLYGGSFNQLGWPFSSYRGPFRAFLCKKILWASMNIGGVQIIHLRHYKYILYAYPGGLFQPSSAKVGKTALQVAWRLESSET